MLDPNLPHVIKPPSQDLQTVRGLIAHRLWSVRQLLTGRQVQTAAFSSGHELQPSGGVTVDLSSAHRSGGRGRVIFFLAFLPGLLSIVYFGFLATDRYVSEAKFIVKTASKSADSGGLGSFLKFAGSMSGMSRSQDDNYSVQEYIKSRAAVAELSKKIPVREIYNRPEADFIAHYPSIFYGKSEERLYDYLQWMVNVSFGNTSGIATLRVQAFRAEDALLVTKTLLELGEDMVNRLNERINADAIRTAAEEVGRGEQRMIDAQMALTEFRNRELMVDAIQSSVVITEVIAGLDAERISTQAQISQLAAAAPDNPQIKLLYGKVNALNGQIADQRALIAEPSTGIAKKLAEFERLSLMREFAKMSLASANTALDNARTEARRQQLYLERVVEPNLPDFPISPQRLRMIATIIGGNALFLLVIWLFYMGVREHGAGAG